MAATTDMIKAAEEPSVMALYSPEKLQILKLQIVKDGRCTDDELAFCLTFCRNKQLDPFTRQVYFLRLDGGKLSPVTAIDGLRSIANRTNAYAPGNENWQHDDSGRLVSATVSVWKLVAGKWFEYQATAFFDEYNAPNKPNWRKMPRVMLAKCAEARALRKGWPDELGAVYGEDELDQATSRFDAIKPEEPQSTVVVQMPAKKIEQAKPAVAKQSVNPNKPPKWTEADPLPALILNAVPALRELKDIPIAKMNHDDLDLVLEQGKSVYAKWSSYDGTSPKALALLKEIIVSAEARLSSFHGDAPPPIADASQARPDFDPETGEVHQ